MAIVQLSRITHRKGLQENLPQLSGAEFGWSLDERRLFIGNGTLDDGVPVIGNTEILTEFSDILGINATYTYKGEDAGYVVSTAPGGDITRTLQSKFDEIVSVRDFGATGDGISDDFPAIDRALYELFCREVNPKIRRALYFPAGVYLIKQMLKIPPYAKCYGDGISSSVVKYTPAGGSAAEEYVVTTSDSLNQYGVNIGNNGATLPTGIEVQSMGFESTIKNSVLLLNATTNSSFDLVSFKAAAEFESGVINDYLPSTNPNPESACIKIVSMNSFQSGDIAFNKCSTTGTSYGLNIQDQCKGLQFENGKINYHFQGVDLGSDAINGGPTGINVSRTIFDNIHNIGILIGNHESPAVKLNSSAFNVFYNVGNEMDSTVSAPVISFESEGNVSIGDLFERSDAENIVHPRIALNGKPSIAIDSTSAIKLGSYERQTGLITTLAGNVTPFAPESVFSISTASSLTGSFRVDYNIHRRMNVIINNSSSYIDTVRVGSFVAASDEYNNVVFNDDYTETAPSEIVFDAVANGSTIDLRFYSEQTGDADATLSYSIVRLD